MVKAEDIGRRGTFRGIKILFLSLNYELYPEAVWWDGTKPEDVNAPFLVLQTEKEGVVYKIPKLLSDDIQFSTERKVY